MKSLQPDKLITVEDNLYINGKSFPFQSQWNYIRKDTMPFGCCSVKEYYIVSIDDVEYPIPTTEAFDSVIKPEFQGIDNYWNEQKYSWPVQPESTLLRPDPDAILERANRVIDNFKPST